MTTVFTADGKRTCSECGVRKYLTQFYYARKSPSKVRCRCKECDKRRCAEFVSSSPERYFLSKLKLTTTNAMNGTVSRKARLRDAITITLDELMEIWRQQNGVCPVSGVTMTHIHGMGRVMTNASIDRIDNKRGYAKNNVRIVCVAVNLMRNQMTDEQLSWWSSQIFKMSKIRELRGI